VGGFTSVFHSIQAAYGWTDKRILNLRVKRLVQIVHVLEVSRDAEDRVRRMEREWQTKTLAAFMSNLAQDQKTAESMLKAVDRVSMFSPEEREELADTSHEEDARTLEDIMENGNTKDALQRNAQRKGPGLPFM
jgi:choline dehydrogenase-like flavoprotein